MWPGNDSLTRTFSDLTRSANNDSHDVAGCTDRNQSREAFRGLGAKDSLEEEGSCQLTRFPDLSCWHGRKVRHVGEEVQDEYYDERDRSNFLEQRERILGLLSKTKLRNTRCTYLDLIGYVKSIGISLVGEVDADQSIDQIIAVVGDTIEGVAEVGMRVSHTRASSQYGESGHDDEQKDDKFDCGDQVHKAD